MCGIVGGIAQRNVVNVLYEGLKRLEYRGYDSAGIGIITNGNIAVHKQQGKVSALAQHDALATLHGTVGLAHTRWATHGVPSEVNAHPHVSNNQTMLVHNGIIENHTQLRQNLESQGYAFQSETDTECLVHLINHAMKSSHGLLGAVQQLIPTLKGTYGFAVVSTEEPDTMVIARSGSPLVIGVGIDETFIASDYLALRPVTDRFVYLEEGDIAQITQTGYQIFDQLGNTVHRPITQISGDIEALDKQGYRHYMLKEIYEQPTVIKRTLAGRISAHALLEHALGEKAESSLEGIEAIQIIACGTSFNAAAIAKYWIEAYADMPCFIEVASEYRYRKFVVPKQCLLLTISQSGETADTLAGLRLAKQKPYKATMTICNVAQSSLVRESDVALMTHAGPEIGVASTKAFTTQLVALLLLCVKLLENQGKHTLASAIISALNNLPTTLDALLSLDKPIERLFERLVDKQHALFLGRGIMHPVAMEGALKLKEISYLHAEAYPAGELKHGPLALVDESMPIVVVAPNDDLLDKLKSNLAEVQARGGHLYVFADEQAGFANDDNVTVINIPSVHEAVAPIVYSVPLQLLAYHVAVHKGTDVDQPRNLAKSVTVE